MNDLSMDFNQKLKTIKGAGKEVLEEGRVTLFKLTGTGGKAIKELTGKGSLKVETYRVGMKKRYGQVKDAPPVINVISEKEILRKEQEWRERVEFLTTCHWQGVKKGSKDLENTKEIELWCTFYLYF